HKLAGAVGSLPQMQRGEMDGLHKDRLKKKAHFPEILWEVLFCMIRMQPPYRANLAALRKSPHEALLSVQGLHGGE
ncbi:MAG: hypothetical protein Q3X94_06150, partial [Oscillospiraceae bacterium]|nr:hypothetical protein [Oscillospiraceae bacterium]